MDPTEKWPPAGEKLKHRAENSCDTACDATPPANPCSGCKALPSYSLSSGITAEQSDVFESGSSKGAPQAIHSGSIPMRPMAAVRARGVLDFSHSFASKNAG